MNSLKIIGNEIRRTTEVIENEIDNFRAELDDIMNNAEKPLTIEEIQQRSSYGDVSGALFIKMLRSNKEITEGEKRVGKKIVKTFEKGLTNN